MAIIELTQDNINEKLASSDDKLLIYFWAPWCSHCQQMMPVLDWVQDTIGDKLTIGKVNVDLYDRLALKYQVKSVPTLLLFEDGSPKKRAAGKMNKEQLLSWLY